MSLIALQSVQQEFGLQDWHFPVQLFIWGRDDFRHLTAVTLWQQGFGDWFQWATDNHDEQEAMIVFPLIDWFFYFWPIKTSDGFLIFPRPILVFRFKSWPCLVNQRRKTFILSSNIFSILFAVLFVCLGVWLKPSNLPDGIGSFCFSCHKSEAEVSAGGQNNAIAGQVGGGDVVWWWCWWSWKEKSDQKNKTKKKTAAAIYIHFEADRRRKLN